MPSFQFQKAERLKNKKVLSRLFDRNVAQSFSTYPIRLIWVDIDPPLNEYPVLFSMSVPKRAFPKAHQRNRIRRQIREAYRLHKHLLYEKLDGKNQQFGFMLLYTAKEALSYEQIERAIQKMIPRFLKQVEN